MLRQLTALIGAARPYTNLLDLFTTRVGPYIKGRLLGQSVEGPNYEAVF